MNLNNELIREYSLRSFYNFFKLFWDQVESTEFVDNWHIEMVCNALQDRYKIWCNPEPTDEELTDLIINLPPGSSKSLIVSVFFPAWIWLHRPFTKLITASYSSTIAEELSGKSLRLMNSDRYKSICRFNLTSSAISNIKNSSGGQRFVTSTSGSVTGFHADIILVDDGNSPQSIHSEAARNEAKKFVLEILPSRKTNIRRSYTVYVQQRLHNEDITGVILKLSKRIKRIIVPAIENGESFYSIRFPLSVLDELREQLGTKSFMAQYMQQTLDEAGGIIKKEWIKEDYFESEKNLIYFLDSAYGGKDADNNAIIGAFKRENNLYIESLELNKYEFPDLINWMKKNIPSGSKIYIEGKASGKSIIQTLKRETNFNIVEIQPKGSKLERKNACSPYFESGRVIINKDIQSKEKLIEQLIFDQIKNDDALDVVMYAIEVLLKTTQGKYNIR